MEKVKTRPPSQLASEDTIRVNQTGAEDPEGAFVRILTVEPEPSVPNAVRAIVEIKYPAGLGRTGTVRMVTVIFTG